MTTDRRLYDMNLGRRDHTRWLGSSGRYSTRLTLPTTNLLADWDARTGVTVAGTGVSSWLSSTGSHNAAQGTDAKRPSLITAARGSAIEFLDANNDVLTVASGLTSASTSHTIFFVADMTDISVGAGTQRPIDITTGRYFVNIAGTGGVGSELSAYDGAFRTLGGAATGYQVLRITAAATGTTISAHRNGALVGTSGGLYTPRAIGGATHIGSSNSAGTTCGMKLYALYIYAAALDSTAAAAVEAYIAQEWP